MRAGATKDPSLLPQVTVAQAARNAAVAAVLKMTYDFQLPTSTVGAMRSQSPVEVPPRSIVWAAGAVRKASAQVERKQQVLDTFSRLQWLSQDKLRL